MAKIDIKQAYRIIPVHPDDHHLLAVQWKGELYVDSDLPFALRSAPPPPPPPLAVYRSGRCLAVGVSKGRGGAHVLLSG